MTVTQDGYFNMRSEDASGCEVCMCNATGTIKEGQCDPLTGACYCKEGFSGELALKCFLEIKSGTLSNTDPRYYNHEASTVDQTIKSRSRGRCVTGMAT